MKKAIVLLSGGIDSTTLLYLAQSQGFQCFALIFDYGQRHKREIKSALAITKKAKAPFELIKFSLPWKGSSLLDLKVRLPKSRPLPQIGKGIPSTYVPARNTIFLSFALSYAEAMEAKAIFIGANAIDFSGYPDCRPNFYRAFQKVVKEGTKAKKIKILTPLIRLRKSQIIKLGLKLKAPLSLTWSCYQGGKRPCQVCDSCQLRKKGFLELGMKEGLQKK